LSDGYSIEEHYQLAIKGHGVLGIRLGSIDLYRTEHGLGFFEWSPQFGTRGYCHEHMRELHMDFIAETLKS